MYPPLAGRTMRTTAQGRCLRLREFTVLKEDPMCSPLTLVRRFPNPIPSGTRLPRWALLDVTVRR